MDGQYNWSCVLFPAGQERCTICLFRTPSLRFRGIRVRKQSKDRGLGACAELLECRRLLSATLLHADVDGSASATVGNTLFFLSDGMDKDGTLWKTDGTTAGTSVVKDFSATNGGVVVPSSMTVASNRLFFVVQNQAQGFSQLWRSDGTPGGTTEIFST